ncbi:MAG: 16S rRNA (guanine(966)-N(2))-methyltransferase RsmD, partial [Armatimonadia bacterium]
MAYRSAMRVIAGSARSLKLEIPKGVKMRPTSDMVREALFNSLGYRTIDCRFADLYAGTGAVGIEALSRGAAFCVFVEQNPRCVEALRANLANTGFTEQARIIRGDCLKRVDEIFRPEPPDIVFMDPPYRESAEELLAAVVRLARQGGRECLVIVQCERGMEPSLPPDKAKRYGGTSQLYYEVEIGR